MEGPAFSTIAESNLYRSWGANVRFFVGFLYLSALTHGSQVVGMTCMPEARLAREAEVILSSHLCQQVISHNSSDQLCCSGHGNRLRLLAPRTRQRLCGRCCCCPPRMYLCTHLQLHVYVTMHRPMLRHLKTLSALPSRPLMLTLGPAHSTRPSRWA